MSNSLFMAGATGFNDALVDGTNNSNGTVGLLATADVYAEFAKLLGLSAQLESLQQQSQQPSSMGGNGSLNDQLNALAAMGSLTGVVSSVQPQTQAPAPAQQQITLLPLPAAYPVFAANGKQIPGLLTDGLGNFWQIVPDDETPDDPANMRELVTEDAFAHVNAAAFSGYPTIGSVSSGSDTAYSPHSPANSSSSYADAIGSPASADIDWDIYKPQQQQQQSQATRRAGSVTSTGTMSPAQGVAKVPSGEIYPSLNLNGFSPAATLVGYTTTPPASSSSAGTISLETVQPMALHSHSHDHHGHSHDHYGHSHPISTIAHPSLQNPLASGIRANSPPRDDVSYPCPVQGCPASFRCASRGVVYAPGRMQLLYSDSVPVDNIEASGGEVVSDRDCEFVRHLFAEHELELSSKEPNPKNGRPEKVWRCPLCPYRSKKCNVEAHMLSAGSGHHPAKHLYCATCSTDGRTVWLYNYQSAVNHFEERHGVRVGKRGPGRRKEVIKGEVVRRKQKAGIAWEAKPDGEVVVKTEPGTEEEVQATYKPILPRPPLPAGFALSKDIKVSEIKTLPDAVDPTNLVSANGPEGWFVDPSLMVLDDGRTVKVGLKADSKADRPKGVARVAGIEDFDEAPVFEIEKSTFEETRDEPVVVATATTTVAPRATPTPTATATATASLSEVDQLTSALSSINLTSSLSAKPLSDLPTLLPSLAPSDLQALRSQLLQLASEAEKLEKQRTASVVQLLEMGFGHAEAVEALVEAKGDAGRAVEVLLKGKEGN